MDSLANRKLRNELAVLISNIDNTIGEINRVEHEHKLGVGNSFRELRKTLNTAKEQTKQEHETLCHSSAAWLTARIDECQRYIDGLDPETDFGRLAKSANENRINFYQHRLDNLRTV